MFGFCRRREAAEDEAGAGTLKGRPWGRSWPGFCAAGSGQLGDSSDLPIKTLRWDG